MTKRVVAKRPAKRPAPPKKPIARAKKPPIQHVPISTAALKLATAAGSSAKPIATLTSGPAANLLSGTGGPANLPAPIVRACRSCRHYMPLDIPGQPGKADETQGACRRFPPACYAVQGGSQSSFPIIRAEFWCGEYGSQI